MRVKREVSGVARHLGKISTLSVEGFKFCNMQICFSACERLNITLKNIHHYRALFRPWPWRRGREGWGREGRRILPTQVGVKSVVKVQEILAAV